MQQLSSEDKIQLLYKQIKDNNVGAYIIPREDEFNNEEVLLKDERLKWLTNFNGSAGLCIVSQDKSAVFVDGRYTIQANKQVDSNLYEVIDLSVDNIICWLKENCKDKTIGFDPFLLKAKFVNSLEKKNINLLPIDNNLIDNIWQYESKTQKSDIFLLEKKYTGKTSQEKIKQVAQELQKNKTSFLINTDPACTSWLFNIRANDLKNTPFVLGYSIVYADGKCVLYLDNQGLSQEAKNSLKDIQIKDKSCLIEDVKHSISTSNNKNVYVDYNNCSYAIYNIIKSSGAKIKDYVNPIILFKAQKNITEQNGMKEAHIQDGLAMVEFLYWLDQQDFKTKKLTELDLADKVDSIRLKNPKCVSLSFDTISAFGASASSPHYKADKDNFATLQEGNVLLLDSGGQYLSGTTDLTRTVAIGKVDSKIINISTLVLKGHIAVASCKFPNNTNGIQIDSLARVALWKEGLNYSHGTGHGVGSFLSVHEGNVSISPAYSKDRLIKEGNVLSNEPGYYEKNVWGVRIENLVLATKYNEDFLQFENLTLCPIDKNLINVDMLNKEEKDYINDYHKLVYKKLSLYIKEEEILKWLANATSPI